MTVIASTDGRRNQDSLPPAAKAVIYLFASIMGGVLAGLFAGYLGSLVGPRPLSVAGVVAGLAFAIVGLVSLVKRDRLYVLQRDRETPQRWVHLGPVPWSVLMGGVLGFGGTTRLGSWAWYAIPIGAVLSGDPLLGATVWGVYGLVRALPVLAWWTPGFSGRGMLAANKVGRRLIDAILLVYGIVVFAVSF